jgi:hypothetical protein
MSHKKYFCSFADSAMYRSRNRIKKQAKNMHIYDQIIVYNEYDLNEDFYNYFKDKLKPGRGFGYWVWKPQIILQTLGKMEDGDILQYTDAGCHLNKKGIKRLREYFKLADLSKTGMLAFQFKTPEDNNLEKITGLLEMQWTKGDVFDYFGVRNNAEIYNTEQIESGMLFIKKTNNNIRIIQKWMQAYYDDFSLVEDTPSKSPNFSGFIENRHDQSILSIIAKINNIPTVSSFECYQHDFKKLKNYPILALRDKDYGQNPFSKRAIDFIKRVIHFAERCLLKIIHLFKTN